MTNNGLFSDTSSPLSGRRGRRVLICVRGECAPRELGKRLEQELLALIAEFGLDDPDHPHYTTCTLTNCLAVCEHGPVMIVHPEGIKYQRLDLPTLRRIFQEHLLGDRPVAELMVRQNLPRPALPQKRKKGRWD